MKARAPWQCEVPYRRKTAHKAAEEGAQMEYIAFGSHKWVTSGGGGGWAGLDQGWQIFYSWEL